MNKKINTELELLGIKLSYSKPIQIFITAGRASY